MTGIQRVCGRALLAALTVSFMVAGSAALAAEEPAPATGPQTGSQVERAAAPASASSQDAPARAANPPALAQTPPAAGQSPAKAAASDDDDPPAKAKPRRAAKSATPKLAAPTARVVVRDSPPARTARRAYARPVYVATAREEAVRTRGCFFFCGQPLFIGIGF